MTASHAARFANSAIFAIVLVSGLHLFCTQTFAQAPPRSPVAAPAPNQPPAANPATQIKLPKPLPVSLKTRDGVQLAATYYASPLNKELLKDAAAVILLHAYKGSRGDFNDLALALQASGCAVLVPDLRGHGESTRRTMPDGPEKKMDSSMLGKQDLEAMVQYDVEACKTFLFERHSAKELNIEKLAVVGAEMGGAVAVNWAAWDWHWPVLATGKQGQDVKAVVLLSPVWAFKGLPISKPIGERDFVSNLCWLVVVGQQEPRELSESKRLFQSIDRFFPTEAAKAAIAFKPIQTSLQGTKMLATRGVNAEIVKFIDGQVAKRSYAWTERKASP
jgi:pimeloyl-ACP methyl ester carboxylesterase